VTKTGVVALGIEELIGSSLHLQELVLQPVLPDESTHFASGYELNIYSKKEKMLLIKTANYNKKSFSYK
jgi:hypothetical protein